MTEAGQNSPRVFFSQAGRFILTGGAATLIDLAVLNILLGSMLPPSATVGFDRYLVAKTISFICAATCSYLMNKHFTFRSETQIGFSEVSRFSTIAILGFCVNVIIPTLLFGLFSEYGALPVFWRVNAASIIGTAVSLLVNFFGYKLFVFRK